MHRFPESLWGEMLGIYLDEETHMFWHSIRTKQGGTITNYQEFRSLFLEHYSFELMIEENLEKLKVCYFRNDIQDYILRFRKIMARMPEDELPFSQRKFFFLDKLPLVYREKILNREEIGKKKDMELLYAAARVAEQSAKIVNRNFKNHDQKNHQHNKFEKKIHFQNNHRNHYRPSTSFGRPHAVTNGSGPMDLDLVDLTNVECYRCHQKGHKSNNCPKGPGKKPFNPSNSRSHHSGDRRKQCLLLINHVNLSPGFVQVEVPENFIPPFQDFELEKLEPFTTPFIGCDGQIVSASKESSESLDGPTEDGREAMKEAPEYSLTQIEEMDVKDLLKMKEACDAVALLLQEEVDTGFRCCKSCKAFGNEDSPPTVFRAIDYFDLDFEPDNTNLKRTISTTEGPQEESLPAHDPDGRNDLFFADIQDMIDKDMSKKKFKLDTSLIDGYQYTRVPFNSPVAEIDRLNLAERELGNVETWNWILSTTYTSHANDQDFTSEWTPDEDDSSIRRVHDASDPEDDVSSVITNYEELKARAID